MQYFFNDHLRWNLGFDTPNQGGACAATLLPWLWGFTVWAIRRAAWSQGGKRWGWRLLTVFFVAVECAATWALVKTYSRGALAGILAALGLVIVLAGWRALHSKGRAGPLGPPQRQPDGSADRPCLGENNRRPSACGCSERLFPWKTLAACLAPWLARLVLLVILLGVSDFTQRLAPDYAATDRSVTNRVDLWKGGLELIALSPLHGWGWGNSGASFMHWTQPIGRGEAYKSMVNSYLTVGVEGGLPVLAGVLGGCVFILFLGIRSTVAETGLARTSWLPMAVTASLLAWLVCLFFSNLWIIPLLWVVPGVTVFCLAGMLVRRGGGSGPRFGLGGAVVFSALACGGLWLAGHGLELALPVVITRSSAGDTVTLALRHVPADAEHLVVLPDARVLGESYGQELRRWVIANPHPLRLRVIASPDVVLPAGETVVAFGAACSDLRLNGRTVLLIHPTQDPDSGYRVAAGSALQLAGIDVTQKNAEWSVWAAQSGLTVGQSWGLANDVRARWPELIFDVQSGFKNR